MSEQMRINLTRVAVIITIISLVGGAIWTAATAQAVRDSDLKSIDRRMTVTELKLEEDHKELSDIRGDLKVIKDQLSRIERKLP